MKKEKVLFVIPTLSAGGAERVFSFLVQHLSENKFDTSLLITGRKGNATYSTGKTSVTFLEKKRVLHAILGIFFHIKKNKPKIIISSIAHLNIVMGLMAMLFKSTKFIIRPTNIQGNKQNGFGHYLAKFSFSQVDKIICQSHDMHENFRQIYDTPKDKMAIIGNPITNITDTTPRTSISEYKNLITVGRLSAEKGHARILSVLSQLETDFHYTMIGEGPELENLFRQIKGLRLSQKISHVPYTKEVNRYLSNADLFLQGSYAEGFPNAVLESCAIGTPVLAFNVPGGTKEIVEHGVNGLLVKSEAEYLQCLRAKRQWDCKAIQQSILSKYSADIIIEKYEKVFLSVLK